MTDKIIKANRYIAENMHKVNARFRNKYHVMPPVGWMNDPNGFIYAFGKYHLFYQFHPYSAEWGSMHWGHYVSDDLVAWQALPVALAPDEEFDKDGCYSGSAVVADGKLYLMYTAVEGDSQTQALAVSDDGVDFRKLGLIIGRNEIPSGSSPTDFRDPKIFFGNGMYYGMIGAADVNGKGRILLYSSSDMRSWTYIGIPLENDKSSVCECPDYFELNGKDVLIYSPQFISADGIKYQNQHSNVYAVGKLDFATGVFRKEFEDEIDSGFDFYAAQTLEAPDGRRIMSAWMSMWDRTPVTKADGWAGSMIFPRELTVVGNRLYQRPIREIEKYRRLNYHVSGKTVCRELRLPSLGAAQDITAVFRVGDARKIGFKLFGGDDGGVFVYYDADKDCVVFDRTGMGTVVNGGENEKDAYVRYGKTHIKDGLLTVRLLLDVSSCEVFWGDGECVMTANIYSEPRENANFVFVEGGPAEICGLDAYNLEIYNNFSEETK